MDEPTLSPTGSYPARRPSLWRVVLNVIVPATVLEVLVVGLVLVVGDGEKDGFCTLGRPIFEEGEAAALGRGGHAAPMHLNGETCGFVDANGREIDWGAVYGAGE